MADDFQTILRQGLELLELEIDGDAARRLERYFVELKKWSRKINLVSKGADDRDLVETHFLDSLTLLPLLAGERPHLLDIGTGAGFPGLAVKCAMPELEVTLVEPRQKRVSFLGHVIRSLDLQGITVITGRIEDDRKIPSSLPVTHITSRAVTEIGEFLEMCRRFMAPEVRVICMKGPKWKDELGRATHQIEAGYELVDRREFTLPFGGQQRSLLVFAEAEE